MKYTIRSIVCEASCHPVIQIIWIIRVIQVIWLIWVIQVIQVIWVIRASFSTLPLTDKLTNNIRTYRFASHTIIQTVDLCRVQVMKLMMSCPPLVSSSRQ